MKPPDSLNFLARNSAGLCPFEDGAYISIIELGDCIGFNIGPVAVRRLVLLVLDFHGVFRFCARTGATSIARITLIQLNT